MGADLTAAFALLETVERLAQVTLLAEVAAGRQPIDAQTLRLLQERGPSAY
jgi:ribulose-5-phosphate 4-epimerase/fuculose-1-phosphate aldolase